MNGAQGGALRLNASKIGGFGGGGAGLPNDEPSGGGGYSGGGGGGAGSGCRHGGGGGSFNSGANQVNSPGINIGHGFVIIDR